jgi:hypothetical protein
LAYRDGVLSPTETSDLHQRIKQTEVASNLLRRIENLVKHKQLLAPKLNGEGLGADPNSVAEYLDDSLASEQVPEFERICIAESDLVLAELAHCHQLLAEALNSQVVVPPSLKALAISLTSIQNQAALSRRLNIGRGKSSTADGPDGSIRRTDDAHPETLVVTSETHAQQENAAQRSQVQAPMVASGGGSIKPKGLDLERPQLAHEVPEYLVGQRSGGWRIPLAIGAMLALLSALAWQALGPLNHVRDLFVAINAPSDDSYSKGTEKNSVEPTSEKVELSTANSEVETAAAANNRLSANKSGDTPTVATNLDTEPNVDEAKHLDTPNTKSLFEKGIRWTPGSVDAKSVLFVRKSVDGKASLLRVTVDAPIPADAEIIVPSYMRTTLNIADHCSWSVCGPTLMQLSQNENLAINTSLCRAHQLVQLICDSKMQPAWHRSKLHSVQSRTVRLRISSPSSLF